MLFDCLEFVELDTCASVFGTIVYVRRLQWDSVFGKKKGSIFCCCVDCTVIALDMGWMLFFSCLVEFLNLLFILTRNAQNEYSFVLFGSYWERDNTREWFQWSVDVETEEAKKESK